MSDVRVRFAPSPTGYLHIGGVRTALYCWLWARKNGGQFILRIEDTDRERHQEDAVQVILDSMRWVGLDWDEGPETDGPNGPYRQSERLDIYREHAEKLITTGHAFRCYSTKEERDQQREEFTAKVGEKKARGFRFQSPWRERTDGDPSQPHTVRFKAPSTGSTGFKDVVRGRIDVPNTQQQDFVLVRPNGMPLYNFCCVVDDHLMNITLVARGDDHLGNTPPQILLYEAFGWDIPKFAHLPMINGPDKKKLSKRNAAVSVSEYRDMGYLPDSVLNYLARLGWSHGDQEIFTKAQLIEAFDWENVGKTPAMYDKKKFAFVQNEHFRMLPTETLVAGALPELAKVGIELEAGDAKLASAIDQVKMRAADFVELAHDVDFYFRDPIAFDEKAKKKFLTKEKTEHLAPFIELMAKVEPFTRDAIEAAIKSWLEEIDLHIKFVAQPARVALTGRSRSPGLYEVMALLGKEESLARLKKGLEIAAEASA